jgi:toxin ParE1/3/4
MKRQLLIMMLPLIGTWSGVLTLPRAFDAEFDHALIEITQAPDRWAQGSYHTRRFLLRRFPYLVIYRVQGPTMVQVLAVAHTSRNPNYWKGRI